MLVRAGLLCLTVGLSLAGCQQVRSSPPGKPARTDAYGDELPPGALFRLGTLRFRHSQHVAEVAFAPDGRTVAALDPDGISFWDAATGRQLRRWEESSCHGLVFAPGGKLLVSADRDGIAFRDLASGMEARRFLRPEPIQSVTLSPDGKLLAWLTNKNELYLADAATGKVLHRWPGPSNYVYSTAAFSPDSRTLALACQKEKEIPLYDTSTGKELRRLVGHEDTVYSLAFAPDGKTLATSARDNTLRFWDPATGKELRRVKHDGGAWKLTFSPDGALLATGGWDVRLWETATGKLRRACERDDDGHVECLVFSPDGKTLAATRDNCLALSFWEVASGTKQLAFGGHLGPVHGVAVSPDGRLLASAAWEKNFTSRNAIRLWDPVTGREMGTLGGDLGFVGGLEFSPDGRSIAAGNEDGTIRIWNLLSRREVRRLASHSNMVEWIGFTADGRTLVSLGYHDRTIRLWDVSTDEELRQFRSSQGNPGGSIVVSPDGRTIVEGSQTLTAPVALDTTTGRAVGLPGEPLARIATLALSPDGRTLAAADMHRGVFLRDFASGGELTRLPDVQAVFLHFSTDGRLLAIEDSKGQITIWEVATGKECCRFAGHRGPVLSGVFTPDGRRFISGSQDSTLVIWDITGRAATGQPEPLKLLPRELKELQDDLGAADASRARRALWRLVAAPVDTIPALRERLRPVTGADPQLVARLLADLDSDDFTSRAQATKGLQKLGEAALPALRKALSARPSPELRRRVEELLEQLTGGSSQKLYERRAVEVLEHLGNPEARRLLESLAGGVSEAQLTRDARASLERLKRLPAVAP